jgi:hypothetical protein
MIDRTHDLPIKRQAELLNIGGGTVYYQSEPVSPAQLGPMRRIDELHLEHPFAGSRMLRDLLRLAEIEVGRQHVGRLTRHMGIQALYRKPKTSKRHPAHPAFPHQAGARFCTPNRQLLLNFRLPQPSSRRPLCRYGCGVTKCNEISGRKTALFGLKCPK